ncbi:universal stress protein [Actinoplanes flavus]|uniref:Universal stress protein n=1 Tax=Actinoplanes flavus TaxID=2820290 RepID=A0ABS3UN71_9ACTN|nr:universal stress protein [Actinoplanes flavus]MBO3740232.1 universal stress protein [Actinoplanes flavus]
MDTMTAHTSTGELIAAIRARLGPETHWRLRPHPDRDAVELVPDTPPPGDVVLAAITEDARLGAVVDYARARAAELHAPLRLVHVWTGRGRKIGAVRMSPESPAHADLMLATAVRDGLTPAETAAAERQILHDDDPGAALRALADHAVLLVVGAAAGHVGDTTGALIGHTACPLALVAAGPAGPGLTSCREPRPPGSARAGRSAG